MSDESSVQESANRVLRNDPGYPRPLVQVDKAEFTKLLHQVLASQHLYIYLQGVTAENKKLKHRNEGLLRILQRSHKTIGQVVFGDQKVLSTVRASESGSLSLPSYFEFDNHTEGIHSSLHSSVHPSIGYFSRSPKSLYSSLYVSEPNLSRDERVFSESNYNTQGRDVQIHSSEGKEKCDPCKDEDTGLSLKVDGDVRSMGVSPRFIHHPVSKVPSPTPSPLVSPSPSISSGCDDQESVSSESQIDDSSAVMTGVSRQYFDVVVKELAKSKQLIRQLLARNSETPKEVMDTIYYKELVKSLEEENRRLKESNQYFRQLLVTEATSEDQNLSANNEILNFHDKVQKLERQMDLKDQALDQLNKQNELWRRYGQKAMATQYISQREDQVFKEQMKDSESQTVTEVLFDAAAQTDNVQLSRQPDRDESAILARFQTRVVELEGMVGDLTTENQTVRETVDLLTAQNRNLEDSYHQVMLNLKELERDQDTEAMKQDIKSLHLENDELKKRLKENAEEMKFLRYQVQSAQSDQGLLSQKKTRVEAMLKSERERSNQRETQLFMQCSKLQQRITRLESENADLQTKILPQTNVARVYPVIQEPASKEPTSMPVTSHDFLWKQGGKDASMVADSELKLSYHHQSDPCLKLGQRSVDDEDQFQCHHCFRNDFHDEKSFMNHMQKCGD